MMQKASWIAAMVCFAMPMGVGLVARMTLESYSRRIVCRLPAPMGGRVEVAALEGADIRAERGEPTEAQARWAGFPAREGQPGEQAHKGAPVELRAEQVRKAVLAVPRAEQVQKAVLAVPRAEQAVPQAEPGARLVEQAVPQAEPGARLVEQAV
ncbi:MAG TPA: hypothetical protein PLH51_21360, partial [Polyangiaceae bacterium]|nr:hypothetical protein [Polyangiaceae bacterium]